MKRSQKPEWQKSIARERIQILFKEAEKVFRENPEYAKRYVKMARKIALRYKVRLGSNLKRKFCKKCFSYLKPGASCTVRLSQKGQSKIIITCKNCLSVKRIPYSKDKRKTK